MRASFAAAGLCALALTVAPGLGAQSQAKPMALVGGTLIDGTGAAPAPTGC